MAHTILLADDHAMVRQGLRSFLQHHGYLVVAEADSGERACEAWCKHRPDLLVLDMDMHGIGGLATLQRILAHDATARVLVFSIHDDTVHLSRAMQAGAHGYVSKSDAPEVLLEAVRRILRGDRFIGHSLAQRVAIKRENGATSILEVLSPREFEVFRRLVSGESLTDIARQLHLGYKSVANVQTQIRQKLNVQSAEQLLDLAVRVGISQSVSGKTNLKRHAQ